MTIASCEVDLDNDGQSDIALLVETLRGREALVLLKTGIGYSTFQLPSVSPLMQLSCHLGGVLEETEAGKNPSDRKRHKTPGAYIRLG
jgi:hypothetical protein